MKTLHKLQDLAIGFYDWAFEIVACTLVVFALGVIAIMDRICGTAEDDA